MTIDSLLEPFSHFGVRLGLEAIQALLRNLGDPHTRVPVIHVAGSNGKGSVCAYLSAVLTEAGYRVGRYTSPHLIHWNERICLNDEPISPEDLERLVQTIVVVARSQFPLPTQFEIMTAAAWLYFAQNEVDLAVMEVGLGGRLDATNVCDRPLVSIITSISREHWQVLGSTLAEIAGEKAGILKPGCPAVIGQLPPEANVVIYRRAAELGCETTYPQPAKDLGNGWAEYCGIEEYEFETELLEEDFVEPGSAEVEALDPDEVSIVHLLTSIRYQLPLQGTIQLHNSALAIAALQILREQGWEITDHAIVDGIAKTRWAGRLQWVQWGDRRILIDGAHNPASAQVLREFVDSQISPSPFPASVRLSVPLKLGDEHFLQESPNVLPSENRFPFPIHWVIGMLSNKDHADIFSILLRSGDSLYLVPVPSHRSAEPEKLVNLALEICPTLAQCNAYPDVVTALEATPKNHKELVVVCGSLYLIGHFLQRIAEVRE